jgi:hypothetical protein
MHLIAIHGRDAVNRPAAHAPQGEPLTGAVISPILSDVAALALFAV